MTVEQMKAWIDNASYDELLSKWRFAPVGDPFFTHEMGDYYKAAIARKRQEVGHGGHVSASKRIGWER